jgi:hypothetical protein
MTTRTEKAADNGKKRRFLEAIFDMFSSTFSYHPHRIALIIETRQTIDCDYGI